MCIFKSSGSLVVEHLTDDFYLIPAFSSAPRSLSAHVQLRLTSLVLTVKENIEGNPLLIIIYFQMHSVKSSWNLML